MTTFGQRVRTERVALGVRRGAKVSQQQLATEAGLSNTTISRWERGKEEEPELTSIRAVAAILGVRPEWLLTGQGPRLTVTGRATSAEEVLADLRTAIDAARHHLGELEEIWAMQSHPATPEPDQVEVELADAEQAQREADESAPPKKKLVRG